jgi:hypothetical protein
MQKKDSIVVITHNLQLWVQYKYNVNFTTHTN